MGLRAGLPVRKISPPPGFDSRTVQPGSNYTDRAIPAHKPYYEAEPNLRLVLLSLCRIRRKKTTEKRHKLNFMKYQTHRVAEAKVCTLLQLMVEFWQEY